MRCYEDPHGGKIAIKVEKNLRNRFCRKNGRFLGPWRRFWRRMWAATNPLYVRAEEIPERALEREKEIYRSHL